MSVASLVLKARQIGGITHSRFCLDQPNRRIRTRMYGGVGGTPCEGRSYPYIIFIYSFLPFIISECCFALTGFIFSESDFQNKQSFLYKVPLSIVVVSRLFFRATPVHLPIF